MSATNNFYSTDYAEARSKFLEACDATRAAVESYRNPVPGPNGEPLYTEVAILGPNEAEAALLLGSGTHGVEGFAGSGVQVGLLCEGIARRASPRLCIVMIHTINPYGFAHLRRVNEDNVDLNRNFVDHTNPYPENTDYNALADAIAPDTYSAVARAASVVRLLRYQGIHGKAALQAAISRGQYTHPQGLFYGGRFETWSNKTFRLVVQRHLSRARRIAFVDLHSGLGPHGRGELIQNYAPGSPAHERAVAWWGDKTKSTKTGEAVGAELTGTIRLAVSEMLPDADVTGVTLEFGTVSPMKVFRAMQAENWLHHHGGTEHPRAGRIKADMRRVFYPDTDDWKAAVWTQGKEVVDQAVSGLIG